MHKYSKELHQKLYKLIANGSFVNSACDAVGISTPTYYEWLNLGKEGDPRYIKFSQDMGRANSEAENRAAASLMSLIEGDAEHGISPDFRAIRFYLERRHGQNWGDKNIIDSALENQAEKFFNRAKEVLSQEQLALLFGVLPSE